MTKRKVEQMEISEGNTIPPQKRQSQSKRWCFTFNNYSDDDLEQMEQTFNQMSINYIIGKEVGDQGTPHLQGYIECPTKMRWSQFKLSDKIHWEKCKGDRAANVKYCSKEGNYVHSPLLMPPREKVIIKYEQLLDWQKEIVGWFDDYEDALFGRAIHWVYERDGNIGKSIVAKYLVQANPNECIMVAGRAKDMQFGVINMVQQGHMPKIVVVNIPRVSEDHFSVAGIESIKDGLFFSSKYESGMCDFNRPWVIVFANCPPPYSSMSNDRWRVFELVEGKLIKKIREVHR